MFESCFKIFKLKYRYIRKKIKLSRSIIKFFISDYKKFKTFFKLDEEANFNYQSGNWIKSEALRSEKRALKHLGFIEGGFDNLNLRLIGSEITDSIGHMAISLAARAKEKKLYPENNYKYIVLGRMSANNKYLDLWQSYFEVLSITREERDIIESIFSPILESVSELNINNNAFELYKAHNFLTNRYEKVFNNDPLLQLSSREIELGFNFLDSLNIKKNSKYVTLHIRNRDSDGNQYGRNSDPRTYVEAIQYLTSNNVSVIRIGSPSKNKIPRMKNFLDLTEVKSYKNEFDVFLLATCKFMIGTTSGPLIVPHTFNIPVVATNTPDLARFIYLPNSLVVPKKIVDKNGRLLTFEEMFDRGFGHLDGYIPLDKQKMYFWLNNSPDEILNAVMEMNNDLNYATSQKQYNISNRISNFGFDGRVKISNAFIDKNLSLFENFGI